MITYFRSTEDVQEDREELTEYGKDLVFSEVRFDELGEYLHGAMHGIW